MSVGTEKPITFASCSLASAERKYLQLEKEGLTVVFGVKKFHSYLFGRHFEITNDHKPLQSLFSATKGVPVLASSRIQRWALILVAYDYSFSHKPGKDMGHAGAMSRLPLWESPRFVPTPGDKVLLMEFLDSLPVTAEEIRQWMDHDPVLSCFAPLHNQWLACFTRYKAPGIFTGQI